MLFSEASTSGDDGRCDVWAGLGCLGPKPDAVVLMILHVLLGKDGARDQESIGAMGIALTQSTARAIVIESRRASGLELPEG